MTGSELIASSNLEFDINAPYKLDLLVELNALSERVTIKSNPIFGIYWLIASVAITIVVSLVFHVLVDVEFNNELLEFFPFFVVMLLACSLVLDKLVGMLAKRALKNGSGNQLKNVYDFSFVPTKDSVLFYKKASECKSNAAVQSYIKEIKGRGLVNIELKHLTEALDATK